MLTSDWSYSLRDIISKYLNHYWNPHQSAISNCTKWIESSKGEYQFFNSQKDFVFMVLGSSHINQRASKWDYYRPHCYSCSYTDHSLFDSTTNRFD